MNKIQKEKISNSVKKLWQNPEYRLRMSEVHKGKKQSKGLIEKRIAPLRGKKRPLFSEEWKRNISEAKKKNPTRYWLGKNLYHKTKIKISEAVKKLGLIEENSPVWKGDNAGYVAKHLWIHKIKGKPLKCEDCGRKGFYYFRKDGTKVWGIHWSNIDRKYTRNPEDYRGLCISCHREYDLIQAV